MSFLIAVLTGCALMPVARRAGIGAGLVDRPTDPALKIHARPIPFTGGIPVIVAGLLALAIDGVWPPAAALLTVLIALALGVVDDVRSLAPWVRLAVLAVAGACLAVATGSVAAAPFVVGLVLACTNATNILDGQDGLVGGLSAAAALGLAWLSDAVGASPAPALALAGGLVAFLTWNRPPASIFLGNGGAYAVGAALASLVPPVVAAAGVRGLVASGLCLGVFAFELVFTFGRRLITRSVIAGGDRSHSYDLLASAIGRTRSTVLLVCLGAATAVAARGVIELRTNVAVAVGLGCAAPLLWLMASLWFSAYSPLRRTP